SEVGARDLLVTDEDGGAEGGRVAERADALGGYAETLAGENGAAKLRVLDGSKHARARRTRVGPIRGGACLRHALEKENRGQRAVFAEWIARGDEAFGHGAFLVDGNDVVEQQEGLTVRNERAGIHPGKTNRMRPCSC